MEEEKGISIKEIFKIIFKRVWWVVGVTAAITIAFVCLIQFWYNPNNQTYSASFELRLPSGGSYPDGTTLRLSDSVLLENLQDIKDEKYESEKTGRFANIDIQKMVEEDDIEFLQTIEQRDDESYEYHNTIKVVKKYFKNKEQAADFVRAVVEFPVKKSLYIVEHINYFERLNRIDLYESYSDIISALLSQKSYIMGIYESLSSSYSGEYVPAGLGSTRTLDDYLREFVNFFNGADQAEINNKISANRYVFDTERYISKINDEITLLEREIAKNELYIAAFREERDALINQLGADAAKEINDYTSRINSYISANISLQYDIDEKIKTRDSILNYTEGDGRAEKDELDAELAKIRADLIELTNTAIEVRIATYKEQAKVVYINNKIEADGGLNIVLAALIGAVGGLIVVSAVIFIIDYPKYKREKLAEQAESGGEQPKEKE